MVPHEIEPAKGAGGAAHDGAGEIVLGEIADQALRPSAGRSNLGDDGINPGLVDVDDPDRRPFAGKAQGARPPIPEAAAVTMPILPSSRIGLPPSVLVGTGSA